MVVKDRGCLEERGKKEEKKKSGDSKLCSKMSLILGLSVG